MEDLGIIELDDWLFDPLKKTLVKISNPPDSEVTEENLEARHSDLLLHLIQLNGEVATRENLIQDVWKSRYVDDRTINSTISRLRKLLGGDKNKYIKTQSKQGYKFVGTYKFIPRPKLSKTPPFYQAETIPVKVKIATIGIVTIIICLLALIFNKIASQPEVIQVSEIEIEPMTYEEGAEYSPVLSHDGKFLAYIHTNISQNLTQIAVQNTVSKETMYIGNGQMNSAPTWSPNTYDLFFTSQVESECLIQKVTLTHDFQKKDIAKVYSCGNKYNYPSLDVSSDYKWLYYIYSENSKPNVVKRLKLDSLLVETLTFPPVSMQGDFDLSINSDNNLLSFIRYYDDLTNDLMMLDLESGSLTNITGGKHFVDSAVWPESNSRNLLFTNSRNTLFNYSTVTNEYLPALVYSKDISSPLLTNEGEIILSVGGEITTDVYGFQTDHHQNAFELKVSSSFTDHSPDIIKIGDEETIVFASNRSGKYEIWLKNSTQLYQLTNFSNKNIYISDIGISNNAKFILFKLDDRFHVLDVAAGTVEKLHLNFDIIRNATWKCDATDIVYITVLNNGSWELIEYNITTHLYSIAKNEITTFKSDCSRQSYYATVFKKPEIQILTKELTTLDSVSIKNIDLSSHHTWAVSNGALYYTENLKLKKLDLATEDIEAVNKGSKSIHQIQSFNGALIFSVIKQQDSYIGKITTPILTDTTILQ